MKNNHTSKCTYVQSVVLLRADSKMYDVGAVINIQRCWRSYKDRVTFKELRSLIHSYEMSNPRSVLRLINKREASLVDKAAGLHVRFRLSGDNFPPTVVYKVYTHRPVVDLCSFSPRQYANGPMKCKETYLRWENNSWRAVTGTPAVQSGPKVKLEAQGEHGVFFTHSVEERRILRLLEFKKRKRAWLMKLSTDDFADRKIRRYLPDAKFAQRGIRYAEDRAQTAPAALPDGLKVRATIAPAAVPGHRSHFARQNLSHLFHRTSIAIPSHKKVFLFAHDVTSWFKGEERWGGGVREENFEDTTANPRQRALDLELLRWSAGLDYGDFERDWHRLATSIPEEYDRDWCKLGTTFPRVDASTHVMPS